jgi:hypothetical protein
VASSSTHQAAIYKYPHQPKKLFINLIEVDPTNPSDLAWNGLLISC